MTMTIEHGLQLQDRRDGVGGLYTIATLGSHSALQILKGARDEGFNTLAIANRETERLYRSYAFVDEVITIDKYSDFMSLVPELEQRKIIIVPHGSFVAYLSLEDHKKMRIPYFGNKAVLDWEASRELQRQWLTRANLRLPRQFRTGAEIDRPVIVKLYGAQGGKGYMFVRDAHDFEERASLLARQNYILQEYVIGVPAYIHYFYSPLTGKLEIMSMDRRYETNVDSLGRIPSSAQAGMDIDPSYVVVGNSPLVLRESLLAEAFRMGEDVVRVSQEICGPKGLFGAFCIETIITPDTNFYVMEISARIVAGTNPFIDGSPYSYLNYSEPMSTGRRIAREIKHALLSNSLDAVLDDNTIAAP
jgi:5-formaminoimidazole-4-carboxamide-1-(beta)-D-ribofuranosyl 5'-monophosphate synthetase